LWPGYDQSFARANLRRALSRLNSLLGEGRLTLDREQVTLNQSTSWVDVAQFQQHLAACATHEHPSTISCPACVQPLAAAMELYQNEFMAGFTLVDSPTFDEWQRFQAESLRHAAVQALDKLVSCLREMGEWPAAISYARRWLALEPYHEPALRALMRLYAQAGDRATALHQFDEWVRHVASDLGLPPSMETTALYEEIKHDVDSASSSRFAADAAPLQVAIERPPDSGAPEVVEQKGQIRTITVLCVGLEPTLQMETEPEEWAAKAEDLLAQSREILAGYEAQVDRLAGDSVVAIFGATQTHEDDAERAVYGALELHAAANQRQMPLCIGISAGEAYYGPIRAGEHKVTAIGAVVTHAIHQSQLAGAGGTLVSGTIYQQSRLAFDFSRREVTLPGQRVPVAAYELVRARSQAQKSRGFETLHGELVGRDEEVARLNSALAMIAQGEGQLLLLVGEAGVGKSRLVAELTAHAKNLSFMAANGSRANVLVLEGRSLEMNQMTPYSPFVDLFRSFFLNEADDAPAAIAHNIQVALQELVVARLLAPQQQEEIGPLLGHLLSTQFGNHWDEFLANIDPQQIRYRAFSAIRVFLAALARRQPLVVILEDIHWADDLSLDLIGELMEMLLNSPILLLCAYRPVQKHRSRNLATQAARKCRGRFVELHLHELSQADSHRLVVSLLQTVDLPPKVLDLVYRKAEGNPFFTEELIRALIDAGVIYRDGDRWRTHDSIKEHVLPTSVQSIILSRFDRLPASQQRLVQLASVIGHIVPVAVLARIASSNGRLEEHLRELEAEEFLLKERSTPQVEYAFRHVLMQEAVYRTLLRGQREETHQQVAQAIEELYADALSGHFEQLAYHYTRSRAKAKAIEYLVKAGAKARSAYLNDDAVDYFELALARMDELDQPAPRTTIGEWKLTAWQGLGQIHFVRGQIQQAEPFVRQAIAIAEELGIARLELFRLYHLFGDILYWLGRFDELAKLGEDGLALLGEDVESLEGAVMNQLAAVAYERQERQAEFLEYQLRNAKLLHKLPYIEELRPAFFGVVKVFSYQRRLDEAEWWLQLFEERVRTRHDVRGLAEVYLVRAISIHQGDYRSAIHLLQRSLELFAKTGNVIHSEWVQSEMGLYFLCLGEIDNAENAVRHLRLDLDENQLDARLVHAVHMLAGVVTISVLCCRRRWQEALIVIGSIGERLSSVTRAVLAGRMLMAQGKDEEAREEFVAAIRASVAKNYVHPMLEDEMWRSRLPDAVSGLEALCDNATEFLAICSHFMPLHLKNAEVPLRYWYLEKAQINKNGWVAYDANDDLALHSVQMQGHRDTQDEVEPRWVWCDPLGDCSYTINETIEVCAANGRDFWKTNLTAPRLLRQVGGDLAIEAVCARVHADRPAIGGLLIWKDQSNFLHLNWGMRGPSEVAFEGSLNNQDQIIGRGHLSGESMHLRLEWANAKVTALCSSDGVAWYSVGSSDFDVEDPVEVGLHAIGQIDRTVYPSVHAEGTAIRFLSLQMYRSATSEPVAA
jgi:DNA-binding SARP family transcriptional activator